MTEENSPNKLLGKWAEYEIAFGNKEGVIVKAKLLEVTNLGNETFVKLVYGYKGSGKAKPFWKTVSFNAKLIRLINHDVTAPANDGNGEAVNTFEHLAKHKERQSNGKSDDSAEASTEELPAEKPVVVKKAVEEKPAAVAKPTVALPAKPAPKPTVEDDDGDEPAKPAPKPAEKLVAKPTAAKPSLDEDDDGDEPPAAASKAQAAKPVAAAKPAPKAPAKPADPEDADEDAPPAKPAPKAPAPKVAPKKPVFEDDDDPVDDDDGDEPDDDDDEDELVEDED